jgi:hypothetical protein
MKSESSGDPEPNPSVGELRAAYRQTRELLALLADELRSPWGAIPTALRLLEQRGHDEATRAWVGTMLERQTQAISRLLEDRLEAPCIEHGKIPNPRPSRARRALAGSRTAETREEEVPYQ